MSLNLLAIVFSTKLLPLLSAIIGFGLLILVHEFGHFTFCKIFGIHTPTFSIGMGPKIYEKKIGETNFRISAIPLGGYLEIAGNSEIGQGDQKHANMEGEKSFANKSFWKKALVVLGGILFNLLFAYTVYSALFWVGIPKRRAEVLVSEKTKSSITEKFGLLPGDKIVNVENKKLSTNPKALLKTLQKKFFIPLSQNKATTINLTVSRNNEIAKLMIETKNKEESEQLLGSIELKSHDIKGEYEKYPLFQAIKRGVNLTNQWIVQILQGIKYLITQKTLKGAGGPLMIISKTFETAQRGFIPLFMFLALISINLAVVNLIPLGALDGGQLVFITIEAIIRRQIPEIIKMIINIGSWVLLLGLMLYLTYKDILAMFIRS